VVSMSNLPSSVTFTSQQAACQSPRGEMKPFPQPNQPIVES
jgi:hypothetical protein